MKIKLIIIGIICIILLTENVVASSPYGQMDVYYNDKLLPGKETAKPILKIGEPFTIGINLTVYQKSEVSIELNEIGEGYFIIVDGSTSKMNVYRADMVEKNSSIVYKWTVKPTDRWAGGSIPIDIVYQIDEFGTGNRLVNGEFTVAYPYISNENYMGEVSTPVKQPVSNTEPSPAEPSPMSASTPAFSLAGAVLILALVFALLRR
jgi:MAST domain-containing protein